MAQSEAKHWLARPRTIRWLWRAFGVILAGLVLGDYFVHGHSSFALDGSFAFYAWFGLITCMVMVLVAKGLGVLLKKRDDYYDD